MRISVMPLEVPSKRPTMVLQTSCGDPNLDAVSRLGVTMTNILAACCVFEYLAIALSHGHLGNPTTIMMRPLPLSNERIPYQDTSVQQTVATRGSYEEKYPQNAISLLQLHDEESLRYCL